MKIALFRISLFLSHLNANIKICNLFLGMNKVFFKKKKKKRKERYAARGRHFSPSLPGDRNQKFSSKSGHRAQISRHFVRYDALVMKNFSFLIRITFGKASSKKASSKMKRLRLNIRLTFIVLETNEKQLCRDMVYLWT